MNLGLHAADESCVTGVNYTKFTAKDTKNENCSGLGLDTGHHYGPNSSPNRAQIEMTSITSEKICQIERLVGI